MRGLIRSIFGLFSNRWQIPALATALGLAGLALYRMRPPEREVQFESLLADLMSLMSAEKYYDAANVAANLLDLKPPLKDREQAILHDRIAEIVYRVEQERKTPDLDNVRLLVTHQKLAEELGLRPDARAAMRAGRAGEWLNEPQEAIESYKRALERSPSTDVRRTCFQALVRLMEGRPFFQEERRAAIDALLAEEGVSASYIWWALQQAMQEAIDHDEPQRARGMLEMHAERFKRSDLRGYHDFLWAWLEISEGRFEEAAPKIDAVDEWLKSHRLLDSELDRAGFLPAMNLWLRGRIELEDARPQQALAIFDRVLTMQSHGLLYVDTALARCEALALLEQHQAARISIRESVDRLRTDDDARHGAVHRLQKTMLALSNQRHELADYRNAVAYLQLALDLSHDADVTARLNLLDRLGRECDEAALAESDQQEQRKLHKLAGGYFGQAANLAALDNERQANLLWASAQNFDFAGESEQSMAQLKAFVETVANDTRLAKALLQLGQSFAAVGEFEEAQVWYRRLSTNYPDLEESLRARLLRADALIMLGENRYDEAESVLTALLADDRLSPVNQNFKDALFTLCDLLYERGRYAVAITRMEEFLRLCEDHPEHETVRFMLADAYRRSALALRGSQAQGADEQARSEAGRRFRRATELFSAFPAPPIDRSLSNAQGSDLWRQLALLYRAECLFELNTSDSLREALDVNRQIVALFQGRPTAMIAQSQLISILLRQGKLTEAARGLERARWLLKGIPDAAFEGSARGMDRAGWERYLEAIADSPLFREIFASAN